jgi:hypothetical protein
MATSDLPLRISEEASVPAAPGEVLAQRDDREHADDADRDDG